MKAAIDYAMDYISGEVDLRDLIKTAQDEAWNEAIEAAAERAEVKDVLERIAPDSNHQIVDKQSILKLLK
jgi:ABC-type multidrug transport system fused ATPase/permease subunit